MRPIVTDLGVAFWRLLPANPIVVRVVFGGSKRVRHLWIRVGYLITLLFVMLLLRMSESGSSGSLADMAKSSTRMFEAISILQLVMMCFLSPIFTAGAITQERDSETFNVLLTTPLTNAQIVLGSLMSRLFFVLMLLLSGLPIFCITMLFGGVTTQQILYSFGIAGCTAILTGSLAITISVVRQGTRGTLFGFYMIITIFLLAGLGLGIWQRTHVPESIIPGLNRGMSWLAPFHPFLALEVALQLNAIAAPEFGAVAHYMWPLNRMIASPANAYMTCTLLASVLMVGFSTFFVRHGIKQGEPTLLNKIFRKRGNGDETSRDHRTQRARRVWSNPVAWREAVTRGSAASSDAARYGYMFLGIAAGLTLLWTYWNQSITTAEARDILTVIVVIEFVSVILMAANGAAMAITRERDSGTMELLLTTPLTSRYILWGKLRGLVSFTVPLLCVPAITVLLAVLADIRSATPIVAWPAAILLPPVLLIYSAVACILGLHMSLKNKGSIQALLATIGVLVVVGLGLGLCNSGLENTGLLAPLIAPMTFVTGVVSVINPEALTSQGNLAGSNRADTVLVQFIGCAIAVGLYGAIVAGTYKSMISGFDMIVRKQQR